MVDHHWSYNLHEQKSVMEQPSRFWFEATGSSSSCGQQSPVSTEDITAHEALPKRTPFSLRLGSFHFIQTWRRFDDHMLDKIIIACSIPYFQASLGPMSQIFTRSHISSGGSEPFSLHFACMSESTEAPPDCWHAKRLGLQLFHTPSNWLYKDDDSIRKLQT